MILTIDAPSFSARLVEAVSKEFLTRRVHYVAPQVWAWGKWRTKSYVKLWHKILCLFPFEPEWFEGTHHKSEWVGHPLEEYTDGDGAAFKRRHNIPANTPVVLLMPGSREKEFSKLLPHFKKVTENLSAKHQKATFVIPVTEHLAGTLRNRVKHWKNRPIVVSGKSEVESAYDSATCALTKSGTVTLQLARAGIPMVIAHKVDFFSGLLARFLIKVPFVGMVNLLVGEQIVPEYLQTDCNEKTLTAAVLHLINNPSAREQQKKSFKKLDKHLRPANTDEHPSTTAARAILRVLDKPIPQN